MSSNWGVVVVTFVVLVSVGLGFFMGFVTGTLAAKNSAE